jgi:hypothetical protein
MMLGRAKPISRQLHVQQLLLHRLDEYWHYPKQHKSFTLPIFGIPRTDGGWDVSWLRNQAGYLSRTAFPDLTGNTALTAHMYDANGNPEPFVNLQTLGYGDTVIIHAWG